jgi:hypothetical protein
VESRAPSAGSQNGKHAHHFAMQPSRCLIRGAEVASGQRLVHQAKTIGGIGRRSNLHCRRLLGWQCRLANETQYGWDDGGGRSDRHDRHRPHNLRAARSIGCKHHNTQTVARIARNPGAASRLSGHGLPLSSSLKNPSNPSHVPHCYHEFNKKTNKFQKTQLKSKKKIN